jgi:hypothetical protein
VGEHVYGDHQRFQLVLLEDTVRMLVSENILYDQDVTEMRRQEAAEETPRRRAGNQG